MFQEWDAFQPLFSGPSKSSPPAGCPKEAKQALQDFCTLLSHVYMSGGDVRFLDRLPASDPIKEEITLDLKYLSRNGRYQQMDLHKQTIDSESAPAADACTFEAKEYWIVRYLDLQRRALEEKPTVMVTSWRYILRKTAAGWEVVSMEPM